MCGIPRIGRPLNAFSTTAFAEVRLDRCLLFIFLRNSRSCGRCLPATSLRGGGWLRVHHVLSRNAAQRNFGISLCFLVFECHVGLTWRKPSLSRPDLRLGYALNLSILVSAGIETKKDSLSNGERTGKSSRRKSLLFVVTCGV